MMTNLNVIMPDSSKSIDKTTVLIANHAILSSSSLHCQKPKNLKWGDLEIAHGLTKLCDIGLV